MRKRNCWEVKQCGRELGGSHSLQGTCPASRETALDGIHGGIHAGRSCWVVPGTCCDGKVQGSFAKKHEVCEQCDFYAAVKSEEGVSFVMSVIIMHQLLRSRMLPTSVRDTTVPCGATWRRTPDRQSGNAA
jgi:hypothetical protein